MKTLIYKKDNGEIMQIIQILTKPKEFFASCADQEPSLRWPCILITIMAVLSAIVGYQMGELTGRLLSGMMQGLGIITSVITAVGSFFSPYIMWVIAIVIFYALQRFFKGTGSFKRVAEITGYGMLPLIFASVVGIILAMYYLPMVAIKPFFGSDPQKINAAVQGMLQDPALHQFSILSSIISIIFMIWAANLWAFGFETCCGLDSKKAMMTAGIPVLVYIIYTLATLFIFTPGGMT